MVRSGRKCVLGVENVTTLGLGAMMMEYAVVKEKSGRIGRQALSKELQQRQAMLEAFFREGTLFSDVDGGYKCGWMGLSCLCAVKQWKTFTGKLLDTYAQVPLHVCLCAVNNCSS